MFEPLYDKREKFIQLKEKLQKTFKTTCPSPSASFYPLGINFLLLHHSQRPSRNLPWNCAPWKRAPSVLVRNPLVQILACLLKLTLQQKETVSAGKRQRNFLSEEKGKGKRRTVKLFYKGEGVCRVSSRQADRAKDYGNRIKDLFSFCFASCIVSTSLLRFSVTVILGGSNTHIFIDLYENLGHLYFTPTPNNFTLNSTKKL